MLVKDSSGRDVEIEIGGSYSDDIQIESASYLDSDEEVIDSEIDFIMDRYADKIEEEFIQNGVMAAESYYEGDR